MPLFTNCSYSGVVGTSVGFVPNESVMTNWVKSDELASFMSNK